MIFNTFCIRFLGLPLQISEFYCLTVLGPINWGIRTMLPLTHSSLSLCSFFIDFGSSGWIISLVLSSSSLILWFACSNLLLCPSQCIFVILVELSSLEFLVSFFHNFYLFSLVFTSYFNSLDVVSFSSLNMFKIVDLKSLPSKSNFWASSGTVSAYTRLNGSQSLSLPIFFSGDVWGNGELKTGHIK